jgi:hypothetical protein
MFIKMETQTRRTEFLFAQIAGRRMELAQTRAAVAAECSGKSAAGRANRPHTADLDHSTEQII